MASRRIHITGGPGSGKSTLARQVAERLRVPCYELDAIGYEGGAGAARLLDIRLADVQQIAAQPAWVTEGVFLGWTAALFEAAEQIVWLDLPWRIVGWRIFTRHVMADLRGNNQHPGWLKLYRFLRWSRTYYASPANPGEAPPEGDSDVSRAMTEAYLTRYKQKLVWCQRPAEVKGFLHSL